MEGDFSDILRANRAYAESFQLGGLTAAAARGLGVLTCIDSRIEPLSMLGLQPGDAKIVRNAGARVTDDALRSLVLATHLLGVRRVMVVAHTDCAMAGVTNEGVRARLAASHGADAFGAVEFHPATDQHATLAADVARLRASPLLPDGVVVAGFEYDVRTGLLRQLAEATKSREN